MHRNPTAMLYFKLDKFTSSWTSVSFTYLNLNLLIKGWCVYHTFCLACLWLHQTNDQGLFITKSCSFGGVFDLKYNVGDVLKFVYKIKVLKDLFMFFLFYSIIIGSQRKRVFIKCFKSNLLLIVRKKFEIIHTIFF